MNSKNELKIAVNFADRVCTISDANGTVLSSIPIREENYSKAKVVEKLGKLKEVTQYAPEAKLPNADITVYEALKAYDSTHKTNYSREYLKIVIDKIPYQSPDRDEPIVEKILRKITGRRLEKEANYLQRARKIKTEQFSDHGLSITYSDIETIEASSELSSAEKGVAIAIVKRQQAHNGIETGKLDKVPLLQEDVREQPPVQPKNKEQSIIMEQPVQPETPVEPKKPEQTVEAKVEPKAKPKAEQKAPKPKNKKKKIEGIKANREAYRQRLQEGKPRKDVRPEGTSTQKKETKQERKARLAREAMQQRRAEKAKKAVKAKQTPVQQSKQKSSKKPVVKLVRTSKEPVQVRFTRKLKDVADSIRNKIYKPNKRTVNICGCVAIAGLMLLAGIKGYQYFNSDNSSNMISETMSAVQIVDEVGENQDAEQTIEPSVESGSEVDTSINTSPSTITEDFSNSSNTRTDGTQTIVTDNQTTIDSQTDNIIVDEGKYFSSPDGTGDYGYFENYQDCEKDMTMIGLATYEGYNLIGTEIEVKDEDGNVNRYIQIKTSEGDILVEADNVELAESIVRQNYPDATYMAVHFEAEHEDESKTTLGWVRSDISKKDNNRTQTQMEDLER